MRATRKGVRIHVLESSFAMNHYIRRLTAVESSGNRAMLLLTLVTTT